MNTLPSSNLTTSKAPQRQASWVYPPESIKRMAVLFTDIVGSTNFFKVRGNLAGREMLQRHQNIVSPAIIEFGGSVVKFLGDSVLAYFFNPEEALKAGIKIQESFGKYNSKRDPGDQIHIRIFIHYGDGIVEDNDIYGDVVNVAAKLLPLVAGDQIVISEELHTQVHDLGYFQFEPIEPPDRKEIFKNIKTYRVTWERGINLDPANKTLLYIHPLWKLSPRHFQGLWNNFLEKKGNFWKDFGEKHQVLPDQSLILITKEASLAMAVAKDALKSLRADLGPGRLPYLPLQVVIDSGPYVRTGRLVLDDLKVDWEALKPGSIYVSSPAFDHVKKDGTFSVAQSPKSVAGKDFFRLDLHEEKARGDHLFLYQNVLIQGKNPQCFYCGDRRHLAGDCPSKHLPGIPSVMENLGYLSLKELNTLFYDFLNGNVPNVQNTPEDKMGGMTPAHYGFFEMGKVFQIRFLKAIWNSQTDYWNKVKDSKGDGDKGGLLWLGQDCIRVSNLEKAESIIKAALEKDPKNYKAHCIWGFLHVEKNNFYQAKQSFEKALDNAWTRPQKIFILFLLFRCHALNGDSAKAKDMIRRIQNLDPYCVEAQYQEIVIQFQEGSRSEVLRRLIALIRKEREYFVNALIDPQLANYNDLIYPLLKEMMDEAKAGASPVLPEAEKAVTRASETLGKEEQDVQEMVSLLGRIKELSQMDSYFAYLDIIHLGESLIHKGRSSVRGLKNKLVKTLHQLSSRMEASLDHIHDFPYTYLIGSSARKLAAIQSRVNAQWKILEGDQAERYKGACGECLQMSHELDQIESGLKRLDTIRQFILYFTGFLKKSLFFQSANLILTFLLFPVVIHYLNFLIPSHKMAFQNIWFYQKAIIILGSVLGFILAFIATTRGMLRKK